VEWDLDARFRTNQPISSTLSDIRPAQVVLSAGDSAPVFLAWLALTARRARCVREKSRPDQELPSATSATYGRWRPPSRWVSAWARFRGGPSSTCPATAQPAWPRPCG